MLNRQRVLLHIVLAHGGSMDRTKLMKLLFLLRQETSFAGRPSFYDFVPYRYGPFSFTAYRDLDALAEAGLLQPDRPQVPRRARSAVRQATSTLSPEDTQAIRTLLRQYGEGSTNQIKRSVYRRYPFFASRSEGRRGGDVRKKARPAVYTLGYEGLSVDRFFELLIRRGITTIADVRRQAASRKYGFSKSALVRIAEKLDFRYTHFPELGVPSQMRSDLQTDSDYAKLFAAYAERILPAAAEQLRLLAAEVASRPTVVVCFEADHRRCHRSKLADALAQQTGLPVRHLKEGADEGAEAHTHHR